MVYNVVFDTLKNYWFEIIGSGGIGIVLIKTFIDSLNRKKDAVKVFDFGGMVGSFGKELKANGEVLYNLFNQFSKEVKKEMTEVVSAYKEEKANNEMLKDLLITTLSVANIPVEQREKFYKSLNAFSNVNSIAMQSLEASIQNDLNKKETDTLAIDNALNEIDSQGV